MKQLHRSDMYAWSRFDETRNIDFNGYLWRRPAGNVVIDPVETSAHERARLAELGGVHTIVITNSDHTRATRQLLEAFPARVLAPLAEKSTFPFACDDYVADGDEIVPGLTALALLGSKTPGELALWLEGTTLVTGDLVRANRAASLDCLPRAKLADPQQALDSLARLAELPGVDAVLPGDGWPVFRGGQAALRELVQRTQQAFAAA